MKIIHLIYITAARTYCIIYGSITCFPCGNRSKHRLKCCVKVSGDLGITLCKNNMKPGA
jgi:hypothetical protein